MQIQVNSNDSVNATESLQERVEGMVEQELKFLADSITRVEVHLNDLNKGKGGADDKRCQIEARIKGMQPMSAEHHAETLELAIRGAASQLARAVKHVLDKADDNRKRQPSIKHMNMDGSAA